MSAPKCQYCKKSLSPKKALKVVTKGQNKYWCDEECYKMTESTKVEVAKMVICQICRKKIDRDTAYKITTVIKTTGKDLNKYYCSEAEYNKEEERKKKAAEDKDRVYYLICDIMGEKEIINTTLFKEWQVWNKVADNAKIAKFLEENKENLTLSITRLGGYEYARIRYLSTIIRNKIKDFKPKAEGVEKPKVVVEETIYEAPTQSLNKRRSLADLEDMF